MNAEEIIKVIYALLGGDIAPIGDTAYDDKVYERAKTLIEIAKKLHLAIDTCACNIESKYASMREVGKVCDDYLKG